MNQNEDSGASMVVDLAFPITPGPVPLDHGYALYSALSHVLPELHEATWLAVHPLGGRRVGQSTLMLTRGSHVVVRLPSGQIPLILGLSGQPLRLLNNGFELGAPTIRALRPHSSLFSRRVAIRLTTPPQGPDGKLDLVAFRAAVRSEACRQLAALGVGGQLSVGVKKELAIKSQKVVAFSIQVDGLSDVESIKLQSNGIGGKRRMGCGVFRSARHEVVSEEM